MRPAANGSWSSSSWTGPSSRSSSCATGRITRLLIADVSGHGDVVAALGRDLRGLMRRYVNFLDQQKFVKAMNAEFVESSAANIFATAIVMTFFAPTRQLSLCNAGHPPPLIYRADEKQFEKRYRKTHRARPARPARPALGQESVWGGRPEWPGWGWRGVAGRGGAWRGVAGSGTQWPA